MTMQVNSNPKTSSESTGYCQDRQYMTREQVAELLKTTLPERWEKLNNHTLEIFVAQEADESKAFEAWNATQQN